MNTELLKAGGSNPELTRRGAMIELLEDLPFRQISIPNIEMEPQAEPLLIAYFFDLRTIAGSSRNSIWQCGSNRKPPRR